MKKFRQRLIVMGTIVFSLFIGRSYAQSYETDAIQKKSDFQWPKGKQMGLSLTFDDARLYQVDKGIPLLDKYGVKATFYLSPDNMIKRLGDGKKPPKRATTSATTHWCTPAPATLIGQRIKRWKITHSRR